MKTQNIWSTRFPFVAYGIYDGKSNSVLLTCVWVQCMRGVAWRASQSLAQIQNDDINVHAHINLVILE